MGMYYRIESYQSTGSGLVITGVWGRVLHICKIGGRGMKPTAQWFVNGFISGVLFMVIGMLIEVLVKGGIK
jgi:hypothetical protein